MKKLSKYIKLNMKNCYLIVKDDYIALWKQIFILGYVKNELITIAAYSYKKII